ncbi:MAG: cellulose biosynthesis cyclic di-GMP-binding regulatory protein BcsB [Sulfurovum sp.]|nr:cellulose biosynthesis cyclic di-GMP-binding regulatory protein BcsB [Sulfurovum sp.]
MFKVDPLLFGRYNKFTFQAIQHYTLQCEDPSSNQLWTDIDLKESYIDFLVRPKPIDEKMASFDTRIFDKKQYRTTPMNYVINNTDDTVLKNYSLFTAVASTHLKYKIERIAVSSDISKTMHNIIIAPKKEARKVLKALDGYYLFDQKPSYALHFNSESCNKSTDNFSLKKDENSSSSYAHFNGGFIKIPKNSTVEKNTIAMWIRSDIQEGEKFLLVQKTMHLCSQKVA